MKRNIRKKKGKEHEWSTQEIKIRIFSTVVVSLVLHTGCTLCAFIVYCAECMLTVVLCKTVKIKEYWRT